MKKYYLLLVAAFIAVTAFAQQPLGKALRSSSDIGMPVQTKVNHNLKKGFTKQSASMSGPRRIQGDPNNIIQSPPETAEIKYYQRSGYYHAVDKETDFPYSYYEAEQSGVVTIAYDGNDVYFQHLLAGVDIDTWVKGTIDGNTITIPLGQFISYSESNNYGKYLTMAEVSDHLVPADEEDFVATNDTESTEITYTIDGNTIIQNGTNANYTLTTAWSDDEYVYYWGSQGGEYETVLTLDEGYTPPQLVVLPEGVEPEEWTLEGTYNTSSGASPKKYNVMVAVDGDDIYVSGLAYYFQEAFLKGTIVGNQVIFEAGQLVGEDEYGPEYMVGYDGNSITDIVFDYDANAQTLTQKTNYIIENSSQNTLDFWGYWRNVTISAEVEELVAIQLPDGIETEPYKLNAKVEEEAYETEVLVGFDGVDVYFVGLSDILPEGVTKATKNNYGQYVVPANQYVGTYVYDFFFTDFNSEELEDIVFEYDEATNTFSTDQYYLNASKSSLLYYEKYTDVTITKTPSVSTAISAIDADSQVRYYDLQGRIVDANSKGVFVKQITLSDGTVKNIKVVRK